jgi:hypothetical protein
MGFLLSLHVKLFVLFLILAAPLVIASLACLGTKRPSTE